MRLSLSLQRLVAVSLFAAGLATGADLKIVIRAEPRYAWATAKESLAGYHKAAPVARLVTLVSATGVNGVAAG